MGRNGTNKTNKTNRANGTNRVRHYETLIYYTRARVGWRMRERKKKDRKRYALDSP